MRFHVRLFLISLLLSIISLGVTGVDSSAVYLTQPASVDHQDAPRHQQDEQPVSLSGWFTIIWGDPLPDSDSEPLTLYMLTSDNGHTLQLSVDEEFLQSQGGALALNGRRVRVTGSWIQEKVFEPSSFETVMSAGTESLEPLFGNMSGNQPYISILCKFADNPDEPKPLAYFQEMYSSDYPRLDHYWRELSYGEINVSGSRAVGWYTLPHEQSYYVRDWDGDGDTEPNAGLLQEDCTGVADPDVYFPDFVGVNLLFNDAIGVVGLGGRGRLVRDGVGKLYGITWEPPGGFSHLSVMEHEMGHSFGLPHSSGNYGYVYDNVWDVMSDTICEGNMDSQYGCLGHHTISYHKDELGWIPERQKYVSLPTTAQTVTLERLALPRTDNYRMVQIPIQGSNTHFYTVEVRETVGHDAILPDSAVIIHEVDTTRREPAHVIDVDGDGDTGDEGAIWRVGETFYDEANTISISVDDRTESGYVITINFVPVPTPLSPTHDAVMLPGDVMLSWTAIQGTSNYDLQIDTEPTFDSPDLIKFTPASNSFTHTFTTFGEYYWRVKASAEASYSSNFRLTIAQPFVQLTSDVDDDDNSTILRTIDGTLWVLWGSDRLSGIWYKTSHDDGATWSSSMQLTSNYVNDLAPAITQTSDGTLWVVWGDYNGIWYKTSSNGGASWSSATQLTSSHNDLAPAITQMNDGTLWVVWSTNKDLLYKTSKNGGTTWSAATPLTTDGYQKNNPAITQTNDGTLWVIWNSNSSSSGSYTRGQTIWYKTSNDGGVTWTITEPLTKHINDHYDDYGPAITQATDGTLWVMWTSDRSGNYGIWYKTSDNSGTLWSRERRWTRFAGDDQSPAIAPLGESDIGIVWTSSRLGTDKDIWFGIPGKLEDINPPPDISFIRHEPSPYPDNNDIITITASVENESRPVDVEMLWDMDGVTQSNMTMLDDGAHGDEGAGDSLYGVQIGPMNAGTQVTYTVRATSTDNISYTYPAEKSFHVLEPFPKTSEILLVIDKNGDQYKSLYIDVLDGLYRYDVWESDLLGPPDESVLNLYVNGIVIWWANSSYYLNWKYTDVITYLEAGGSLFVTGQGLANGIESPTLLRDYLHAIYKQYDTGLFSLKGVAEDPIGDSLALNLSGGDGADNHQWEKNEIDPIAPAVAIFKYDTNSTNMMNQSLSSTVGTREGKTLPLSKAGPAENISSGTAALRVDTGTYKAVFFAFGFEGINSLADRFTVMERVIPWLGSSSPTGALGSPNCDAVTGWAGDKDNPNRAVDVHIYADGPYGTGTFIGEVSADVARESAVCDALGGVHCDACPADEPQCKHGFTISHIPAWLKDGESHDIYAYAINLPDSGGDSVSLLSGVPKTFQCQLTPTPSPIPFTVTDQLWLPMLLP